MQHLVDLLSRIGDVRCLYVNIGDQNLEPDQWTSFLLGSRLAKLRLEELVFLLYSAVRVTLGGMIKVCRLLSTRTWAFQPPTSMRLHASTT